MITATKTTHRFFTSEHGTGSILTMHVPAMPGPGELVEYTHPAVGYVTEHNARGWISGDQRYAEEGTYVFTVAGAGSGYVEFVVDEADEPTEVVDLARELPSRKAALQWLKVNTGLALADRQMILAEAKAGAFGAFDTTTGNGLRVICDYWTSNGHYVITVKSLPVEDTEDIDAQTEQSYWPGDVDHAEQAAAYDAPQPIEHTNDVYTPADALELVTLALREAKDTQVATNAPWLLWAAREHGYATVLGVEVRDAGLGYYRIDLAA